MTRPSFRLDGVDGSVGHAAIFVMLSVVSALVVTAILKRSTGANFIELGRGDIERQLTAKVGLIIAFVLLPTTTARTLFDEPLAAFGFSWDRGPALLFGGLLFGGALLTLTCLIIALIANAVSIDAAPWRGGQAKKILANLALWASGAFVEEATFRGYVFIQLVLVWSFWPAALLSSAIFAAIHWPRGQRSRWGGIFAAMSGLMLCHSVIMFHSIWFAVAFHCAWNFFQSFVFGLNNSGGPPPSAFRSWSFTGPIWITGGDVGPEGSIVATLLLVISWLGIAFLWA